ncbi:phage portal protein [Paenibacillus sp. ACRRY]|uniref:XkdQ/YqbQ family protein n=1 Tax=Paenibacillus sp. ACRRY TaxID=2918208 RepID=UPI001EF616A8|nr:phage portal protein [Paenibacillus sp. ACRRY]MCG7385111.1 phage portal protein [Paenibacillus sp. ACRRY]
MMELFVVRSGGTYQLPVQDVEWSGAKLQAPRTLAATILSTTRGMHRKQPVDVGDQLLFRWKGEELFRGTIFAKERTKSGSLALTAYDDLVYLTKSEDKYVFTGKTLGEIVRRICADFGIPIGTIAATPHKLTRIMQGTLFDIILTAISLTYKHTRVKYYLYSDKGKLHLTKRVDLARKWVIEDGSNLVDYAFSQSIEDTYTQVKLTSTTSAEGKDGKEVTSTHIAKVDNPTTKKRYGTLQYYEEVSDELNKAQLMQRATAMMMEKGKMGESFTIDALGIAPVISGSAVYVIAKELGVNRAFYVDEDSHTFHGNEHMMSLTLTKTDDLPDIDATVEPDEPDEPAEDKDKSKKKSSEKKSKEEEDKEFAEQLRKEILG